MTDLVVSLGEYSSASKNPMKLQVQRAVSINKIKSNKSIYRTFTSFLGGKEKERDSSDEDETRLDGTYARCISWQCTVVKGKMKDSKTLCLDPFSGLLIQRSVNSDKSILATSITDISFISDESVNVSIRGPKDMLTKQRVYCFPDRNSAMDFKLMIEYINEFGEFIKLAFKNIIKSENGKLTTELLRKSLHSHDIQLSFEEANQMILYYCAEGEDSLDYLDFFQIFAQSYVRSTRECLLEWLRRVRLGSIDLLPPLSLLSGQSTPRGSIGSENHSVTSKSSGKSLYKPQIPSFMPGERQIVNSITNIRWSFCLPKAMTAASVDQGDSYLGNVFFTNYRLVLTSSASQDAILYGKARSRYCQPDFFSQISIPLNTILKLHIITPGNGGVTTLGGSGPTTSQQVVANTHPIGSPTYLFVMCKDLRVVKICFYPGRMTSSDSLAHTEQNSISGSENGDTMACSAVSDLVYVLQSFAFPLNHPTNNNVFTSQHDPGTASDTNKLILLPKLFAFSYRMQFHEDGWDLSDICKDFVRQGILGLKEFRVLDNSSYKYCPSYPSCIVVPSGIANSQINIVAAHRFEMRFPAVTYYHPLTKSILCRSAQPMVGMLRRTCKEDIDILNLYRFRGLVPPDYTRLDSSLIPKFYIFDLRSYSHASSSMTSKGGGTEDVSQYLNTEVVYCNIENLAVMRSSQSALTDIIIPVGDEENLQYYSRLEESNWLKHIRSVLTASVLVVEKLNLEGSSVLVHCSNGVDRTSQVCALAQVMADPYYRTLEGLAVLIEKDFCGFGFRFQDRCSHGVNILTNAEEKGPIFTMFLECLAHILKQFSNYFEYNQSLLLFLADHQFSGLFGNFLGNTERERKVVLKVMKSTQSLWSYVYEYSDRFVNQHFEPYLDCLWPCTSVKSIGLWDRYYFRWDPKMHPYSLNALEQWHDDWGNGFETVPDMY